MPQPGTQGHTPYGSRKGVAVLNTSSLSYREGYVQCTRRRTVPRTCRIAAKCTRGLSARSVSLRLFLRPAFFFYLLSSRASFFSCYAPGAYHLFPSDQLPCASLNFSSDLRPSWHLSRNSQQLQRRSVPRGRRPNLEHVALRHIWQRRCHRGDTSTDEMTA